MPEGLKIQVGADVQQAVKALASDIPKAADVAGNSLSNLQRDVAAFGGGVNKFIPPAGLKFAKLVPPVLKADKALQKLSNSSSSATQATINLGRVVQDAPFGFLGIANNLNPLLESFQRLKASTGSTGGALKAFGKSLTGAGGIGLGLSVVSSLLVVFGDKLFGSSKAAKETTTATDQLKDSIKGVFSEVGKEATQITSLVAVLKSETETRERKLAAIKELQSLQPDIFNNLKLEKDGVAGLDAAYTSYLASLKTVIAAKITQQKLEQLITKQLILQGVAQTETVQGLFRALDQFNNKRLQTAQGDPSQQGGIIKQILGDKESRKRELDQVQRDIDGAFKELVGFSKGIDIKDTPSPVIKKLKDKVEKELRAAIGSIRLQLPTIFDIESGDAQSRFSRQLKELESKIRKTGTPVVLPVRINIPNDEFDKLRKQQEIIAQIFGISTEESPLSQIQKEAVFAAQAINEVLQPAFKGLFDAILAGENPLKAFFTSLGNAVAQLIQKLISAAITAAILSAIFPGGVGGSVGFGSIFGKILGFAAGGLVTGPQLALIGEGSGTSKANPEVVAPLDKLKGMLTGMGGGSQVVVMRTIVRGNNLALVQARTSRSQKRTTGR